MDIAKILETGAQYGLDGKVLADFLRDERTAQRESEKEAAAVQAKTALAQLEIERLDKANAEREKERQHELEVLQLQRQTAEALAAQREVGEPAAKGVKPKLPPFDDSKEEIDAYLHRFERYANAQKWDKSTWSTSLSALLKGEALSVYYRLPVEDYDNYDAIKNALLKRYQLTEQGFRDKFRKACPERGETFTQFLTRLEMYMQRWIELSGIAQDYVNLRDLLLREQALNVASKDLKVFLQERKPKNAKEMGILAEQYLEVHGKLYDLWHAQNKSQNTKTSSTEEKKDKTVKQDAPKNSEESEAKSSRREEDLANRTCFICHQTGHYYRDCKLRKKKDGQLIGMQALVIDQPASAQEQHIECQHLPQVIGRLVGYGLVSVMRDTGCNGVIVKTALCPKESFTGKCGSCIMVDGSVKIAPIVIVELDTPYLKGKVRAMAMSSPVFDVVLGNVSGAREASDPDPDWKPEDKSLNHGQCTEQHSCEVNLAESEGQFGQTSGGSEAMRSNDVCMGTHGEKIPLVNPVSHPSDGEFSQLCRNAVDCSKNAALVSASVLTRSQAKVKVLKPLRVVQPDLVNVDRRIFISFQKEDRSPDKAGTLVGNPALQTRSWWERYFVEDDVLYRQHTSSELTGQSVTRQLVLSKSLGEGVLEVSHDLILAGHLGTGKTLDRVLFNSHWPGINAKLLWVKLTSWAKRLVKDLLSRNLVRHVIKRTTDEVKLVE